MHVPEEQETRRADNSDSERFVATTLRVWKQTDEDYEKSLEVADAQIARQIGQDGTTAQAGRSTLQNEI